MEDFTPRPYQVDLYETALKQNTIVYLPTGSGKTYIAVMLIKKYSNQVALIGGKRIIFIVNTVPLVSQQSEYIARHTGLLCRGYSGDMGVDYWTKEEWLKEIANTQVLIMVGDIFLALLNHGHMTLSEVCLIIFDECHKAVGNHNMRLIMKSFKHTRKEDQPRVLGLSATILNGNVSLKKLAEAIRELEITFHARIATTKTVLDVEEYGNQSEKIVHYDPPVPHNIQEKLEVIINGMNEMLQSIKLRGLFVNDMTSKELAPESKNNKLKKKVMGLKEHLQTMGLYGANKSLLLSMIQLESMKKSTDDENTLVTLEFLVTQMMKMRKLIDIEMKDYNELEKIYKFSSDQILKTLHALKHFHEISDTDKQFCCIIFVEQRVSVHVIYHILKTLRELDDEYSFLQPDYIVGNTSDPLRNPREVLCVAKWNKEALLRFRSGRSNCIVATDVVEEGVDIPECTLILRYDLPNNFRGYIQSKGRARHKKSDYVMLIPRQDTYYETKLKEFKVIERSMKKELIGHTDERENVTKQELDSILYKSEIEPYFVTNKEGITASVTEVSSVPLINRYCSNLNTSKFISLTPTWILHKFYDVQNVESGYQVSLTLPVTSPLRETIKGDIMESIDLAKKSVALKTCIKLHEIGELSDNLLPTKPSSVLSYSDYLFPHWRDEDSDVNVGFAGTQGRKRIHDIKHAEPLYSAFPTPNVPAYLHLIQAKPSYPRPFENRQAVFYDLLNDKFGFALLTTKRLPQIPDFPIYMNVGELNVHIEINYSEHKLSNDELNNAQNFQWTIFSQILKVIKPFMMFDVENLGNSFLVVPVDECGEISWSTMVQYSVLQEVTSSEVSNVYEYELALVKPNYRASSNVYVVTQICDDLMAESAFPNGDFRSYMHYYKERHGLTIRNPKQPMLEVKTISQKINCTRPRGVKAGLSKRKCADVLEQFEEHFVGELCNKILFPAGYWLKATYLPSVLHRVNQLLVADDLRVQIISETLLGVVELPSKDYWPPIVVKADDPVDEQPEAALELSHGDDLLPGPSTATTDMSGPEIDILESNLYPWKRESEPTSLFKDIERIQLIDIEYYHMFMSNSSSDDKNSPSGDRNRGCQYARRTPIQAPRLKILCTKNPIGPSPASIMEALTAKLSHDVFNYERLETLGDSFLKFAVSLYLYMSNPTFNEGKLTALKGKLVGNRNLFYCGEKKMIPGRIKVDEFEPMRNFIPPSFTVKRALQKILLKEKVSPNVLYELSIPSYEQMTGYFTPVTFDAVQETVISWNEENAHTGMESFLDVQKVPDKCVSDCVESLIGIYLNTMGVKEAFKILSWFGILPAELQIDQIIQSTMAIPVFGPGNPDDHMPQADYIEHQIGYKFKDRAYLLQAFTHPSYTPNNLTPSYERLEFLGDAILDLLITIHIYESCGDLSPGALTDLRSALVNNITFACIAVKYGFHTALLAYAPKLLEIIERFVKFQTDRGHAINDELLWILLEEEDCNMAEFVDVPKILGDLFESVIGAIYVDTGKDLSKVWEIVYGLMHKEIADFSKHVPKQPIRVIHETPGANPRFSNPTVLDSAAVMITLEVTIAGKMKVFHGFGASKKQAKCAAAKQALKSIRSNASK